MAGALRQAFPAAGCGVTRISPCTRCLVISIPSRWRARSLRPLCLLAGLVKNSAILIDDTNPAFAGKLGNGLIDPLASIHLYNSGENAFITPSVLNFTTNENLDVILYGHVDITSTNAPASYSINLDSGPGFSTPINPLIE